MKRSHWILLLAITAVNCGATALTLHQAAQAREDFREATVPIAKLGAAILESVNRIGGDE